MLFFVTTECRRLTTVRRPFAVGRHPPPPAQGGDMGEVAGDEELFGAPKAAMWRTQRQATSTSRRRGRRRRRVKRGTETRTTRPQTPRTGTGVGMGETKGMGLGQVRVLPG